MKITKDEMKKSTKHSCGYGYCQRDSAEREEHGKALIAPRMIENDDTNAATTLTLIDTIANRANLNLAYKRVVSNKGSGGIDRMAVEDLKPYLMIHAKEITQSLKDGTYMVFWKRWKRVRTKYENLKKLGISHEDALKQANTRKGYWRTSKTPVLHRALSNDRLEKNGFVSLLSRYKVVKA